MAGDEHSNLISVRSELVLHELVENLVEEAGARADKPLAAEAEQALQTVGAVLGATPPDDAALAALARLARSGWYARLRELERFQPAQRPLPPALAELLREGDWSVVTRTCADLSAKEPVTRPSPDDTSAVSWQVPGPGGHVRHYVALRAIGSSPAVVDAAVAMGFADPSPLKRVWLFGFLLAEAVRERGGRFAA